MPMCVKCGSENHEKIKNCFYCGADLTLTTIENMDINPELFKKPEYRQRIMADQIEKLFNSKLKFVFYVLAILFPLLIFALENQYPQIKNHEIYQSLNKMKILGICIYLMIILVVLRYTKVI